MTRLGKRLGVRQQAMATAQLYIRRFYSKVEIRKTNPYLVLATAVYLACKMEECPHHIRLVVSEGRGLWPAEESNLAWSIVNDHYMTDLPLFYAPHTIAIMAILLALVLRPNATGIQSASGSSASNIASAAQAALTSAGQAKGGTPERQGGRTKVQKLASWLAESTIDVEAIVDCTQEMISFYEAQEHYNEKLTREQINRFIKARGLDK
ncbi:hypothetical protein ACHAPF_005258 [Botrytis cinerea]